LDRFARGTDDETENEMRSGGFPLLGECLRQRRARIMRLLRLKLPDITMNPDSEIQKHHERNVEDNSLRRAFAARLNRALNIASISSAKFARRLGVSEHEVLFWRRGITVPQLHYFTRIAEFLQLDALWLCSGQVQGA
jgi:transcriptional regulator with XRE-family HTH domain